MRSLLPTVQDSVARLLVSPNIKLRLLFWEVDVIDSDSLDIGARPLAKVGDK